MKEVEYNDHIYYIGKNQQDNDKMFDKMADDMTWFHLENYSSAHVYVKIPKDKTIKRKVIKHAAKLVREHSKNYGKVCYVLKKHLKKGDALGEIEFDPEHMKII